MVSVGFDFSEGSGDGDGSRPMGFPCFLGDELDQDP